MFGGGIFNNLDGKNKQNNFRNELRIVDLKN